MADEKTIRPNDDSPPGLRPDGTLAECSEDYDEELDVPEPKPETKDRARGPRIYIHRS
jgi:hypothetical protein